MIILFVLFTPIYWKWRQGTEFILDQQIVLIFTRFIILKNIPALIIYLNYYLENKDTKFTLDYDSDKIIITENRVTKEYQKNDIVRSTYHLRIYYKNSIAKAGRIPMLISDFGY